jgi:hypothetical protein
LLVEAGRRGGVSKGRKLGEAKAMVSLILTTAVVVVTVLALSDRFLDRFNRLIRKLEQRSERIDKRRAFNPLRPGARLVVSRRADLVVRQQDDDFLVDTVPLPPAMG